MSYQFLHIETYSKKPTKVAGTKDQYNSVDQVFGEAMRVTKYSTHVEKPQEAIILTLLGAIAPKELKSIHDELAHNIRVDVQQINGTRYHRGLKSDNKTLYTEIHSYPAPPAAYRDDAVTKRNVNEWVNLLLRDFVNRMPSNIKYSFILHLDESHVHVHILAVNVADPKLDANKLHVGKVAAANYQNTAEQTDKIKGLPKPSPRAYPKKPRRPRPSQYKATQKRNKKDYDLKISEWLRTRARIDRTNEKALNEWKRKNNIHLHGKRKAREHKLGISPAFTNAMIQLQDDHYTNVAQKCGLLRIGPGAQRQSTKQAKAEKAYKASKAELDRKLAERERRVRISEQKNETGRNEILTFLFLREQLVSDQPEKLLQYMEDYIFQANQKQEDGLTTLEREILEMASRYDELLEIIELNKENTPQEFRH